MIILYFPFVFPWKKKKSLQEEKKKPSSWWQWEQKPLFAQQTNKQTNKIITRKRRWKIRNLRLKRNVYCESVNKAKHKFTIDEWIALHTNKNNQHHHRHHIHSCHRCYIILLRIMFIGLFFLSHSHVSCSTQQTIRMNVFFLFITFFECSIQNINKT